MRIECSSISKFKQSGQPGDDVPVMLPGRCFAVFDGATDVTGARLGGLPGGRFAAIQASGALVREVIGRPASAYTPEQLIAAINAGLADALAREAAAQGHAVRAATTIAMVEREGDTLRFIGTGDSGIRINGSEVHQRLKPVDDITATGRVRLYRLLARRGTETDKLESLSRQGIFHGFDKAVGSLISAEEAAALVAESTAALAGTLAADLHVFIEPLLRAGIANGQYQYANRTDHALGYAVIDGTTTRGYGFWSFERPAAEVRSVELFTDGYMTLPREVSVAAWEAEAARVEAVDRAKTGAYPGVKGSTDAQHFDDRTVIVISGM